MNGNVIIMVDIGSLETNDSYRIIEKKKKEEELKQFHRNLLKNFSLQNVIEYLTILNADKVLEFVDETLEQLQIALGRRFCTKTIIGLNIHISCLVELPISEIHYVWDYIYHDAS